MTFFSVSERRPRVRRGAESTTSYRLRAVASLPRPSSCGRTAHGFRFCFHRHRCGVHHCTRLGAHAGFPSAPTRRGRQPAGEARVPVWQGQLGQSGPSGSDGRGDSPVSTAVCATVSHSTSLPLPRKTGGWLCTVFTDHPASLLRVFFPFSGGCSLPPTDVQMFRAFCPHPRPWRPPPRVGLPRGPRCC